MEGAESFLDYTHVPPPKSTIARLHLTTYLILILIIQFFAELII